MPYVFRTELHGKLVEFRLGDFGSEQLLINGQLVNDRLFAGLRPRSHFNDLTDEQGKSRHVEIRVVTQGLKMRYDLAVSVDGVPRPPVASVSASAKFARCFNCGYELKGLPVEHGEVRCPECGRHSAAAVLGLSEPQ